MGTRRVRAVVVGTRVPRADAWRLALLHREE